MRRNNLILIPLLVGLLAGCSSANTGSSSTFNSINIQESSLTNYNSEVSDANFVYNGSFIKAYIGSSTRVVIPSVSPTGETIEAIGNRAFKDNVNLVSVDIPNSVKTIGDSAFEGCSSLNEVKTNEGLLSIGESAFNGCSSLNFFTIPNTVTSIGSCAFLDTNSLVFTFIPKSVISLGANVFNGIKTRLYIESSYIPTGWSRNWNDANVHYVQGAHSADLYNGMIYFVHGKNLIIDSYYNLDDNLSVPNIIFGFTVTSINFNAFKGSNLKSIILPASITDIGDEAFANCTSLTYVYLPSGLKTIQPSIFAGCTSLETISLPDGVIEIKNCAFMGCISLKSINLSSKLETIGQYAFEDCSSLNSIRIPSTVTYIGAYAFNRCSNLHIFCSAASQPEQWSNSWNISNCQVTWGVGN